MSETPLPTHAGTLRLYRPSNGTEGDWFMSEWCDRCARIDFTDEDSGCPIMANALFHAIDHPDYPAEWQYSNGGAPQCTAFTQTPPAAERCPETPDLFQDRTAP